MASIKKNFGRVQQWRNEAIATLVAELTELGNKACKYAISQRGYENQKYNLRDSVGSAVYVDGRIVPSTRRYAYSHPSSTGPYLDKGYSGTGEYITGRDAIDRYWAEHQTLPSNRNTVELVVVAGTFYAGVLEARGIQVISAATDFLEEQMGVYKSYRPKLRARADMVNI